MDTYIEPTKTIPVYGTYDVIVVGGGCAGFTAAVAAARRGAKTLIIERYPFFGGTATASLMADIVGIRNQVEPNDLQVMKGLGEELILRLLKMNGARAAVSTAYKSTERSNTKGDLSYSYAFSTEAFKLAALQMVKESGCDILFHAFFSDTIKETCPKTGKETVKGVIVETKSGRYAVMGTVVIDASGDGDVAARAGAEFMDYKMAGEKSLDDCIMYKVTGFDADNVTIGSCVMGTDMVLWGPSAGWHDSTDARSLSDMEVDVRLRVAEDFEKLKVEHPELKDARISETAPLRGIRQTRFIKGEYVITGEDVLTGVVPEDSVAMAANPVIRYYGYRRFLEHNGYGIPYRCFVPEKLDGLLVAGRCISSDQIAYESWRAMSTVLCMGEAAGTAAALAVKSGKEPRAIDVKALQAQLIEQGAEIGQNK